MPDEIVEVKRRAHDFLLDFFSLLLSHLRLHLFDEADDVAHAENAARHPFRIKGFERVHLLPDTGELDGFPRDFSNAQRGAASRVAVHLGENGPRNLDGFVKRRRERRRLLTGHRVDDEQRLIRPRRRLGRLELTHELFVDVQSTRRVHDDDVHVLLLGLFHAERRHLGRIPVDAHIKHRHIDLHSQRLQLIDRRRSIHVRGDEQHRLPLLAQRQRQLPARRRLPDPLQTRHQNHRRLSILAKINLTRPDSAHERAQLIRHALHQHLPRLDPFRHLGPRDFIFAPLDKPPDDG